MRLLLAPGPALLLASCGGGDDAEDVRDPAGGCRTDSGLKVEVVNGGPSCEQAKQSIGGYDRQGEKVNEVGAYTCEGGEAASAPVVVTCVAGDNEITGSEK